MLVNGKVKCDVCGKFPLKYKFKEQVCYAKEAITFNFDSFTAEAFGVDTRYDVCVACAMKAFGLKVVPTEKLEEAKQ